MGLTIARFVSLSFIAFQGPRWRSYGSRRWPRRRSRSGQGRSFRQCLSFFFCNTQEVAFSFHLGTAAALCLSRTNVPRAQGHAAPLCSSDDDKTTDGEGARNKSTSKLCESVASKTLSVDDRRNTFYPPWFGSCVVPFIFLFSPCRSNISFPDQFGANLVSPSPVNLFQN